MRAGTRLGPYEIVAPLGAGGMGEVYRARDTRLGRDVAIKVLPPEFATDPERLRRFEQEARAASALNHPNIVVIFDVGAAEESHPEPCEGSRGAASAVEGAPGAAGSFVGLRPPQDDRRGGAADQAGTRGAVVPYLVEELLEGETLRERLKGGALPARKATELAVQVAAGLAAAHEKGIVHRDLKPENVFLTADGRVKVLDFGVAKLKPPQAEPGAAPTVVDTTAPGVVIGTVAYMSPEQVRGQSVDHRSDIFSLGCVLYEALTGRRAFGGDTAADTMSAILKEEPAEIGVVQPGVPPALAHVVSHCLEKRPEERFQSTRDLAFDLKAIATDTGGTQTGRVLAPPATRRRAVRLASGAVAILAVAAGAYVVVRGRAVKTTTAFEPKRIVVAVFENLTGDPSLDPLGRMASDWITQGLSRVEELDVVPSTSVLVAQPPGEPAPPRGDPLLALAEDTGAGVVVSGSYYVQGERLYLHAKITDGVHRKLLFALDPASTGLETPLEAIDDLRQRVMGALAASSGPVKGSAYQQRPPTYEAYSEFIKGFEAFLADNSESLRHMDRAAEIDPEFAAPLLYAAYMRRLRGDWAEVETLLTRVNEKRDQLTPLGRHVLDGLTAWVFHRFGEALQFMRGAQGLAPRDPLVNHWVGLLAVFANRPGEAAATFGSFRDQPWGLHLLGTTWVWLHCESLHMLGRYEEQLVEARRGSAQFAEDPDLRNEQIGALAALGRLGEMNRAIEEVEAAQIRGATPADSMVLAARELRAHGHREESLALAERAAAWYRGRPSQEAETQRWQRGLAEALSCAERWRESRSLYERLVTSGSTRIDDIAMIGVVAARSGDRAAALEAAGELEHLDRTHLFGKDAYCRACIAASLGDREGAVELLREALAQGCAFGTHLHTSLALESLWDYPPFRELIRPKG